MAIQPQLSRKLHEIFGTEAAKAMADWMNGVEGGHSELRGDLAEFRHETRVEFASVREEMRVEFASVRQEMRVEFANVREEMGVGFATLREEMARESATLRDEIHRESAKLRVEMLQGSAKLREEMQAGFASVHGEFAKFRGELGGLRTGLAESKFELMKWAFGFWIGSLAMLTGVLALFVRFAR